MIANPTKLVLSFIIGLHVFAEERQDSDEMLYSSSWVIETAKDSKYVDMLAEQHGFINRGKLGTLHGHFLLQHKQLTGRMRRSLVTHTMRFMRDPHVTSAMQQKVLKRSRRGFSDPLYGDQWHLNNTGQTLGPTGFDINVGPVWRANITGRGVLVSLLDDGIEYTHPDLKANYDARASYDYNSHDPDPYPRYTLDNINRHGTRCAGQVAAEANNNVCGVGVAYNARIGGVRMLDGEVTDAIEGASLSHARQFVDIYSSSWGPDDDGRTLDGPGPLTKRALKEGIRKGRGGLGSIFVFASGNGGWLGDHCSCDGYVTSLFTVSVGAVDNHGKSPWYSERCPATLAVTYSSGDRGDRQIVTTDLRHKCTHHHTGSSAASPMAAGIFALVLEANPKVSWRDLQHLIANTSRKTDPADSDWQRNGAGYHVNHKYGFGVLDSAAMVAMATSEAWKTAKEQKICKTSQRLLPNKLIPRFGNATLTINSTGCIGLRNCVTKLEHVRVYVRVSHPRRGSLRITLTSPSGTRSELLAPRLRDFSSSGLHWSFLTVFSWGESPVGQWSLTVSDTRGHNGFMKRWALRFYGICDRKRDRKHDRKRDSKRDNNRHKRRKASG